MSRASENRKRNRAQRRVMAKAGVALMERRVVDSAALVSVVAGGSNLTDFVAFQISELLSSLDLQGADILGRTVITIGEHPDYPGDLTIEAKVASKRVEDADPGCPIDHSDAGEEDDV